MKPYEKAITSRLNSLVGINKPKGSNTMRKTKLTRISEIPTYYRYSRITYKGHKGYVYFLSDPVSDAQRSDLLNKHNNLIFMTGEKEYAPELKTTILFVADKVIKH